METSNSGWSWFQNQGTPKGENDNGLALAFARCFRGADGKRVLEHLRSMTVYQAMGPSASDAMLRHAEGQRQLVTYIQAQIDRGRGIPGAL